jgi:radical SAM superfamily enzyme YgiQ (UPF0313 family)
VNVLLCSTYDLGHQPLALALPASHLLEIGAYVRCCDLAVDSLERATVHWADVVAISVPMHTAIRLGVKLARQVRTVKPNVHICFYGLYASLNRTYLLAHGADSVIGGEVETPLLALIRHLSNDSTAHLEGVNLTRDRRYVPPFLGRQRLLVPARHLLPPLQRYAYLDLGPIRKLVGYVEASRGCAHTCLHCPIPAVYGGRLRIIEQDVVLNDIAQLVDMGAQHIDFGDPDFLNGVKHSLAIARRMHERFPALTFNVTAKVEHIVQHRAIVRELRSLGCLFIQSAVESFSSTVLRYLQKGHTEADVRIAKEIADRADVTIRPTLIGFTPWTTLEDYVHLLDVVRELQWIHNIAPVQYAIRLLLPPGSLLLDEPETQGYLTSFNEALFTYDWIHPDPRMEQLYELVNAIVRDAGGEGQDPHQVYERLRSAALSLYHEPVAAAAPKVTAGKTPSAKLSEQWFC